MDYVYQKLNAKWTCYWFVASAFLASSCLTNAPRYISQREPATQVAPIQEISSSEPKNEKPLDLFVRQKDVLIRRKAPVNETGSLTDLNDPRAYLFGFERPVEVGMFIDVKIASNRADTSPSPAGAESKPEKTDGKDAPSKDVAVEDLLKSLPSLEPGTENKPVLLKNIKMQVMERFDNGDVLVMHRRRSIREGQGADVTVTARVPAEALARVDNINTLDLADVNWRESFNGDVAERKSANWEDEYSLRLSGFDETKSKDALGLEEKRAQLKSVRDKLENEMKGFAGERSRLSDERAKLLEGKAQDAAKIADLEKQNSELQKKVDQLAPKEDPKLTTDGKKSDSKTSEATKSAGQTKESGAATKTNQNNKQPEAKADVSKPVDAKKKG